MTASQPPSPATLRRSLGLYDLILYGVIVIQPTAPMPIFGVVNVEARGHVVSTVLIGMLAMLLTAASYGRMARVYPSAGSAFTYVGRELHASLGFLTGWAMAMDYLLNPVICTIWCSQAARNILPEIPFPVWAVLFAALFTGLNVWGIRTSARINTVMAAVMGGVILVFLVTAIRHLLGVPHAPGFLTRPFYDPSTFSASALFTGTSIAVLTYIGFDGISTLAEEVENPRRNILLATVITCALTGLLASVEVYVAQLVWPGARPFTSVDTAFVEVAGVAGGAWLYQLVNATLLLATIGSGMGAQLGAARLLFGMGRGGALPRRFFGAVEPRRGIPRNNVLLVGALALTGAFLLTYQLGAELLNFGAFIAFMGVNLAAFRRQLRTGEERSFAGLVGPLLGFAVCLFIWLNLRRVAKLFGLAWVLLGLLYGAFRTRGFKSDLSSFDQG